MDAAIAEVAIERGLITVAVDQRLKLAQILAKAQGVHRCIFPADIGIRAVTFKRQCGRRGAGFADVPDGFLFCGINHQPVAGGIGATGVMINQRLRLRDCGVHRVGAKFNHDPRLARRQLGDIRGFETALLQAADNAVIKTLGGDRAKGQDFRHRVACAVNVRITEHQHHAFARAMYEFCFCLQRQRACAFGADQRARDVETVFRQQLIEVVTGDAAFKFRVARTHELGVFVAQLL